VRDDAAELRYRVIDVTELFSRRGLARRQKIGFDPTAVLLRESTPLWYNALCVLVEGARRLPAVGLIALSLRI